MNFQQLIGRFKSAGGGSILRERTTTRMFIPRHNLHIFGLKLLPDTNMMRWQQNLGRLRPHIAALFEQNARFSSSAEAKPLAWVFLGPPVRQYAYKSHDAALFLDTQAAPW